MMRPRFQRFEALWTLGALLLIAGGLRVAYLHHLVEQPDFQHPSVDSQTHDYWARGLATNSWKPPENATDPDIKNTPYFRPPGYPYFLAGVYALTSQSYWAPRIVQMILGLLAISLAFLLAHRWVGRIAALAVGLGMSLYWGLIYFEGELQAPALLNVLLLSCLYCLCLWRENSKIRFSALAAVFLGLAVLVRPNVVVFVPVVLFWLSTTSRAAFKQRWRPGVVFLFVCLVITLGATVRNYRVSGEPVWISSNAGINLYIGNNPQSTGLVFDEIPGLGPFGTCFNYPLLKKRLEKQLGRDLTYNATSNYFSRQAWEFISREPGVFVASIFKKVRLLWGTAEVGHNKEIQFEKRFAPALRFLPGFAVVLTLALLGFAHLLVSPQQPQRQSDVASGKYSLLWLCVGFVVTFSLSILPFFVSGRYRIPMVPFLWLLGGFAIQNIVHLRQHRLQRQSFLWILGGVGLYLVLRILPQAYEPDISHYHYMRGVAFMETARPKIAEDEFVRTIKAKPSHFKARHNLATLLVSRSELQPAVRQWQAALQLRPDISLMQAGIGAAYAKLQRDSLAVKHFTQAVQLAPEQLDYRKGLALSLSQAGEYRRSIEQWSIVLRMDAGNASIYFERGRNQLALGRIVAASTDFEQALELQRSPSLANNMAWLLATHPEYRNADLALRFASWATQGANAKHSSFLATLAAAQAAGGEFDHAIATLDAAIRITEQFGQSADKLRQRRTLYQQRRLYTSSLDE